MNAESCYACICLTCSMFFVTACRTVPQNRTACQEPSVSVTEVQLKRDGSMKYAEYAKICTGRAKLYMNTGSRAGNVVCINAGHGTAGGEKVKTPCHPDRSPKYTDGTTKKGAIESYAISDGMELPDGSKEAFLNLTMACLLRDRLIAAGYSVLMIRETPDVQLDNISRTILANTYADCHISIHWDDTESDKGAFCCVAIHNPKYLSMEPVHSTWQKSEQLASSLISALSRGGIQIWKNGLLEDDLTQISFSVIPTVDIELGDKASDHSDAVFQIIADSMLSGINDFFYNKR